MGKNFIQETIKVLDEHVSSGNANPRVEAFLSRLKLCDCVDFNIRANWDKVDPICIDKEKQLFA